MLITKDEFTEMGFTYPHDMEDAVEGCVKRAEYILNALCGGALYSAARNSGSAELVKQAVAFETFALLKTESESGLARVQLGDFSYTEEKETANVSDTVIRLLRAAGCFYGAGIAEVRE